MNYALTYYILQVKMTVSALQILSRTIIDFLSSLPVKYIHVFRLQLVNTIFDTSIPGLGKLFDIVKS